MKKNHKNYVLQRDTEFKSLIEW